jgi:hypothetical protein
VTVTVGGRQRREKNIAVVACFHLRLLATTFSKFVRCLSPRSPAASVARRREAVDSYIGLIVVQRECPPAFFGSRRVEL